MVGVGNALLSLIANHHENEEEDNHHDDDTTTKKKMRRTRRKKKVSRFVPEVKRTGERNACGSI